MGFLRTAVVLSLMACLVLYGGLPASAAEGDKPTLVDARGKRLRGPYRSWVNRARVPLVRGRVRVLLSGCPGHPHLLGCVFTKRLRRIYLRRDARAVRSIFFHELGHLFDLRVMRSPDRRAFKAMVDMRRRRWFGGYGPPAEQFAEAYALCAVRARIGSTFGGRYRFSSTPRRHTAACRLIRKAAGRERRGPAPPRSTPPVIGEPPPASPPAPPPPSLIDSLLDL